MIDAQQMMISLPPTTKDELTITKDERQMAKYCRHFAVYQQTIALDGLTMPVS
jgi:hypothetical protein